MKQVKIIFASTQDERENRFLSLLQEEEEKFV